MFRKANCYITCPQVFGLNRFRETELIHGRWAMLATLGVIVAEGTTGVAWQDAGKVELDGASYLGFSLPFTVTCVTILRQHVTSAEHERWTHPATQHTSAGHACVTADVGACSRAGCVCPHLDACDDHGAINWVCTPQTYLCMSLTACG